MIVEGVDCSRSLCFELCLHVAIAPVHPQVDFFPAVLYFILHGNFTRLVRRQSLSMPDCNACTCLLVLIAVALRLFLVAQYGIFETVFFYHLTNPFHLVFLLCFAIRFFHAADNRRSLRPPKGSCKEMVDVAAFNVRIFSNRLSFVSVVVIGTFVVSLVAVRSVNVSICAFW